MIMEGKTKRLTPGPLEGTILMETKDELTGGDAAKKATITGIARHKTTQAVNVFQLLAKHSIPLSFIEQPNEISLLCYDCDMLPLELVMRRYAWGSCLKREPQLQQAHGRPFRFDEIRCEMFHKWAVVMPPLVNAPQQLEEGKARSLYLRNGQWQEGVYTDPYIHRTAEKWELHSAKVPLKVNQPLMRINPVCTASEVQQIIHGLMLPCFQVLENAWKNIETEFGPVALADIKIEVGRRKKDGTLVIADVIDNDSWRIWPGADPSRQLDKQNFRDGHPLSLVSDHYALVAELTQQFIETL